MDAKLEAEKKKLEDLIEQAVALAATIHRAERGKQVPHSCEVDDDANRVGDRFVSQIQAIEKRETAVSAESVAAWQETLGEAESEASDDDPRNYLFNNRKRMRYDRYRQLVLPVTTAWMESFVKDVNYRVKGTEIFWNDPIGAKGIL